jgi:general secretion pathway protein C
MRLALDARAQRLLRRVPRTNVYTLAELVLLSLLAIQCARLVWTIATPVGPVGDWRSTGLGQPAAGAALAGGFDPFFRLSGEAGRVAVTSLSLVLYGVRQDQASGRGSAIIATPDGVQKSYGVGEEIVPGVTLASVEFDSVTLSRGGATERLYMDQSAPAAVVAPAVPGAPGAGPRPPVLQAPSSPPPPPMDFSAGLSFQPRMNGSQLSGVAVQPQGSGEAFRAAGFAPGDVIVAVNGRRLVSPEQVRSLPGELGPGASVQVERDGRTVRLQLGTRR